MYSNIKVYQKYLATSIKVGCATRSLYASSGPKAEEEQTLRSASPLSGVSPIECPAATLGDGQDGRIKEWPLKTKKQKIDTMAVLKMVKKQ